MAVGGFRVAVLLGLMPQGLKRPCAGTRDVGQEIHENISCLLSTFHETT